MLRKLKQYFSTPKGGTFAAELPETPESSSLDIYSPTWRYISSWLSARLEQLRQKNDGIALDETATAVLRGRIKMIKEVLDLPGNSAGRGLLNNIDKGPVQPPRRRPL